MTIVVDTGPLYALADRDDLHHTQVAAYLEKSTDLLVVPVTVLPEACYLIRKFLGHKVELEFIRSVAGGELHVENLARPDLPRIAQLVAQYGPSGVAFVDASLVAVAERLAVVKLLTLDARHFRMVRPRHCDAFELVP